MNHKKSEILDAAIIDASEEQKTDLPTNPKASIKLGLLILIIGFGGFLGWSFLADLDEGITSNGTVIVDTKRKIVQHASGGVIEKILVKDGDEVKEGQALIQLISTTSSANLTINQNAANLLRIQITSLKPVVDEGYYPLNQYLDLKRQYDDARVKIKVAKEEMDRTEIKAPVSGVVMGLSANTVGGVISPGGKVLEVVPEGDRLVIEAQIQPHLIDKIHAGLEADIRFSALNQRTTPTMTGRVEWVSADRFQDPNRPEISYYTARVALTDMTLEKLKNEQVIPGMPADVIIKTGSRTFWNYLIKPIKDRAALSLKER